MLQVAVPMHMGEDGERMSLMNVQPHPAEGRG